MSGTYIFSLKLENHLHYCFLFKFFLLRQINVDCTNISLCERLRFNSFSHTFLHFTIVILTWYDFTSQYMVLPMSISAWVFHT